METYNSLYIVAVSENERGGEQKHVLTVYVLRMTNLGAICVENE